MKYRIAICDDEISTCEELDQMTSRIFHSEGLDSDIDVFYSGEVFVNHINGSEMSYDFVLLDIELYELNGVGVGNYIRNKLSDVRTQIIYISSKTSYAMDLFCISPLDFLVKPISQDRLKAAIKRGIAILVSLQECFECMSGKNIIRIPTSQILYFESEGRKICLHTSSEDTWFYEKLSHVADMLSSAFIQIHKSYIVNVNAVKEFHADHVILFDMRELPISRTFRDSVRRYMMERLR